MIAHGTAVELPRDDPVMAEFSILMKDMYVEIYGPGWRDWFDAVQAESAGRDFTGYIEPRVMFAKSGE